MFQIAFVALVITILVLERKSIMKKMRTGQVLRIKCNAVCFYLESPLNMDMPDTIIDKSDTLKVTICS